MKLCNRDTPFLCWMVRMPLVHAGMPLDHGLAGLVGICAQAESAGRLIDGKWTLGASSGPEKNSWDQDVRT
jgi:hypothetical protein